MSAERPRKHLAALVLLGMAVVAAGAWWLMPTGGNIRNVLLISIDTCRADHLSCYGYEHPTTPNIDALAAQGILFENTISPVPLTLPSHSTMLTGTIPPYHGVHLNTGYRLADSIVSLPELLQEDGFATGAAISAYVLDSQYGLAQGFDFYDDTFKEPLEGHHVAQRRGGETTDVALDWIEQHRDQRFFFFLHYYDPHANYSPPEPFASRFESAYAGEIAYTDHCIGKVIQKLKDLDLYDSTLIIVVADHGEMLGEHGEPSHAYFIYQSAIRIPLIFKLPGQDKAARIPLLAGLVDVMPTICSLLGVTPPPEIQGRSLEADWTQAHSDRAERYMYCESFYPTFYDANPLVGVVSDQFKFIQTTRAELYDLVDDPAESHNLFETEGDIADMMEDELDAILDQSLRDISHESRITLNADARERLQSLGYVGDTVTETTTFDLDPEKEDPKDNLAFHLISEEVSSLKAQKRFDKARGHVEEMIRQKPDLAMCQKQMTIILAKLEQYRDAIPYGERAAELDPFDALNFAALGQLYALLGETGPAIDNYRLSLAIDPQNPAPQYALGKILLAQKKFDEASEHLRRAVDIKPDFPEALTALGNACQAQGQLDEAIEHYQQALKLDPEASAVHYNLGNTLTAKGIPEIAISHYRLAIQHTPDHTKSYNNLAWLLATEKDAPFYDPAEAVKLAQKACEITNHGNYKFMDLLAIVHAANGDFPKAVEAAYKALALAEREDGNAPLASLKTKLELFKAHKPYHPGAR